MDVHELLRRQREGFSLERELYVEPEIFEQEFATILGADWLLVSHESRIPEPGDYFLFEIGGESLIFMRDKTRAVVALFNVCRHRGSRICEEPQGRLKWLSCAYHGWTYELNGRLKKWRWMPEGLSPDDYGLASAHVRILEGLIFVSLRRGDPPDFEPTRALASPLVQAHGIASAKIAHIENYRVRGNWKLVLENFHECYHCPSSHPQYTGVYAFVNAQEGKAATKGRDFEALMTEWRKRARVLQPSVPDTIAAAHRTAWGGRIYRSLIGQGYDTGTQDGRPVAPLMGEFDKYDGGHAGIVFSYLSAVAAYNDYAIGFCFSPLDATTTDMTIFWLVRSDAEEGRDYDKQRLIWLWDITSRQDKDIIERNARGVRSRRYVPGPYSALEVDTCGFTAWYLRRMVEGLPLAVSQ